MKRSLLAFLSHTIGTAFIAVVFMLSGVNGHALAAEAVVQRTVPVQVNFVCDDEGLPVLVKMIEHAQPSDPVPQKVLEHCPPVMGPVMQAAFVDGVAHTDYDGDQFYVVRIVGDGDFYTLAWPGINSPPLPEA